MASIAQNTLRSLAQRNVSSVFDERGKRIGNKGAVGLFVLALVFDVAQLLVAGLVVIPFIGFFLAAAGGITITLVAYIALFSSLKFCFKNVTIIGGSQMMFTCSGFFAPLLIELMPFLSAIPALTPGVLAIIYGTRLEDVGMEKSTSHRSKQERAKDETQRATLMHEVAKQLRGRLVREYVAERGPKGVQRSRTQVDGIGTL